MALIAYGSLYPWHFHAVQLPADPLTILLNSWNFSFNRFYLRDILVNIAIYIPAGLTGELAFRRFRKPWLSLTGPVVICAALSATVEMTQLFVPSRTCSVVDLITNVFGSILGVILAVVIEDVFFDYRKQITPRVKTDRGALFLLAWWAGSLLFPLFPVLGTTLLRYKLGIFLRSPLIQPITFLSAALAWMAAGTLFRAAGFRPSRGFVGISVLLIPAQFFIVDRQPTPAALTGAILGTACFILLWPKRNVYGTTGWKILAWAFLVTIALRALAPFDFIDTGVPFSWIPFAGFLHMEWQTGVQVMAEKTFWYGTAIWLFVASGMRIRLATSLVAAVLMLLEIAQIYLPGHIAEITDPLWAIFVGWVLLVVSPDFFSA